MPRARCTQTPGTEQLTLFIHYNMSSPLTSYGNDPFLGRLIVGVRDGDEVRLVGVQARESTQVQEGLFGN